MGGDPGRLDDRGGGVAGREHRIFRSLYPGKADCREGLMATLDYPTLYRLGWVDMERTVRML